MTDRFTRSLPEAVTVETQVRFLIGICDEMIKQTSWVRSEEATTVITCRRLVRFLEATKVRLEALPADADPATVWLPRDMQAMLWAIGVEVQIDFDEEEEEGGSGRPSRNQEKEGGPP